MAAVIGAGPSNRTSGSGQNPKNSNRVYVFRCSPNNGHLAVLPCRLQT
jgi:hypothetical protein